MIIRQTEITDAFVDAVTPLLCAHWKEIEQFPEQEVNVDWDVYRKLYAAGAYKIYVAEVFGQLVGYLGVYVAGNLHSADHRQAVTDLLYVHPVHRNSGLIGTKLIKHAERKLRAEGVYSVHYNVSEKHDFSKILIRQGYHLAEKVYIKRV